MTLVDDPYGPVRRTVAFVASMILLLGSARSGASEITMWVAFGVFVSIATIWIRGQYADSLDGRQWVVPWRAGVALAVMALAVLLVPAAEWFGTGFCGVGALVVLYLLAGSFLTHLRQSPSVPVWRLRVRTGRFGVGLTAAGVALVTAGVLLLASGLPILVGAVLLGLGVLLFLPVGLALAAEGALRSLCRRDRAAALLWGLGVGGAAVFALATWFAVDVSASPWLTPILVVLGLVVVALVSTTQADIVVVLAVVALMGVTPPQAPRSPETNPAGHRNVLVALGDSYLSGEGAQVYYQGTDDGGENECRRSPTAWPVMTVPDHFDAIQFLACSGARTRHIMTRTPEDPGAPEERVRSGMDPGPEPQYRSERYTQLDAYRAAQANPETSFRPMMVVLSIGGNDAGFSSIGEMCVAPGECQHKDHLWRETMPQLRRQLRVTYLEVARTFRNVPVVVVPYPDPIRVRPGGCSDVALSEKEQAFIHDYVVRTLNPAIADTAREYGFHYLTEMQDALVREGLELCSGTGGQPGINFIDLRSVHGFAHHRFNPAKWLHGSLHPNERGHAAMLRVFERWRDSRPPYLSARLPIPPAAGVERGRALHELNQASDGQVEEVAEKHSPPCDLLAATEDGCRQQAQTWAYKRIGSRLVDDLLFLLITAVVGGAWCVGVAFFGYRRRVWARRSGQPPVRGTKPAFPTARSGAGSYARRADTPS
ncbi:GDSL-type esterase/lipase family protein [Actinoplanes subglobosus]|uniref:GDSL-type esterase/lipase family protein n=1 Tax=Actinoplanes subglobosus TaxID=1547892 RepID=A0ABV8J460_9ACTN